LPKDRFAVFGIVGIVDGKAKVVWIQCSLVMSEDAASQPPHEPVSLKTLDGSGKVGNRMAPRAPADNLAEAFATQQEERENGASIAVTTQSATENISRPIRQFANSTTNTTIQH